MCLPVPPGTEGCPEHQKHQQCLMNCFYVKYLHLHNLHQLLYLYFYFLRCVHGKTRPKSHLYISMNPLLSSSIAAVMLVACAVPTSIDAFQLHGITRLPNCNSPGQVSSFTSKLRPISIATHTDFSSHSGRSHSRRSSLSMHMGHSHSHHHHHDHDHKPAAKSKSQPINNPTTLRGKILNLFSRRGRAISILFAAAATILPVLLFRQRRINKTDIALFAITSTVISLVDNIRSETKYVIDKAKGIRDGLIKHAPPTMNASKYLFQNDNAADRVTLVGVVINLLLSLGKGIIGVTCHSSALIADAGHSLSDLFSDFITLWAVQIARLPPDDDVSFIFGCLVKLFRLLYTVVYSYCTFSFLHSYILT